MIKDKIGYSYNDLTIVPAVISRVKSRKDVNPYYEDGNLPIFTAPMSTVVCTENVEIWEKNKITPIIPRNIKLTKRLQLLNQGKWVAFSLKEVDFIFFKTKYVFNNKVKLCIDIANGHMSSLIDICKRLKKEYHYPIEIMTGNIANPETIIEMDNVGIDYVRCGIGGGSGCSTSPNTGIHYPMGSLIDECYKLKQSNNLKIKIIADGGIRNFGDVCKALALGADYVMIGSIFASFFESAAPFQGYEDFNLVFPPYDSEKTIFNQFDPKLTEELKRKFLSYDRKKEFYGMSTKKAQALIKPEAEMKTAEGVHKILDSKYTVKQWIDNMTDYLRSSMSYTDKFDIQNFIGKVNLIINSISEIHAVNK